jgi:hypothetical protein
MKLRRNFSQRAHPIHTIGPKTHVLGCFGPFCYCTKVDADRVGVPDLSVSGEKFDLMEDDPHDLTTTSSLNEVALELFATNAPDPLHWTQNSCFGTFRTVSLLYESRCKSGQTSAINAQVRQTKLRWNFSQRTHPIYSIGPRTHILGCFGPFHYCSKVDAKLVVQLPLTHKFANRSCVEIFGCKTG